MTSLTNDTVEQIAVGAFYENCKREVLYNHNMDLSLTQPAAIGSYNGYFI